MDFSQVHLDIPASLLVVAAAYTALTGLGEFLLACSYDEVQRWGRAVKLVAPLQIGAVAIVAAAHQPNAATTIVSPQVLTKLVMTFFLGVTLTRLAETKLFFKILTPAVKQDEESKTAPSPPVSEDLFAWLRRMRNTVMHTRDEKARARALAEAAAAEAQQLATVERMKQECLDAVAEFMPAHLDRYAKHLALSQSDVARNLGRDGIATLRADLKIASVHLGAEVRSANDQIEWPAAKRYFGIADIDTALSTFLNGPRIAAITDLFTSHGFRIDQTTGVRPQNLYNPYAYDSLAHAFRQLYIQVDNNADVLPVDDRDAVELLWEET